MRGDSLSSKQFLDKIRLYNSSLQMTSFNAPKEVTYPGPNFTFTVQGQVYHRIGSILPMQNDEPKFLQIYFVGNTNKETTLRCNNFPILDRDIVQGLQVMLHSRNALIRDFKCALDRIPANSPHCKVLISADKRPMGEHARRYNTPAASEVAVLMVGDPADKRDIVLELRDSSIKHISETHRSYDALQYPLIFWNGQDGYMFNIPQVDPVTGRPAPRKTVSANDFYAYHLMVRQPDSNHLLRCRDLLSQFVVDMYCKIESERLLYIKLNQKQLRVESYAHLRDSIINDGNVQDMGQMVILPSSFTGGPRYMHEKTQDAMTYVRQYGRPSLFITFTCNPKWEEIRSLLEPGQQSHHRHDVTARVFRQKVIKLMQLLTKGEVFGSVRCYMYTVEWQKRGLPHVHILLWLSNAIHPRDIDSVICAELPDSRSDPLLFNVVKSHMIHGPCGALNRKSPCMDKGECTKGYPRQFLRETQTGRDGYPLYRRRKPGDGGHETVIGSSPNNAIHVDNRWVVPFNPLLSKVFQAHINVEYCNSIKSIKYVTKYVNKGSDMAVFGLQDPDRNNEVNKYQTGRYVSSSEAVWRIFNFPIHERYPAVEHLAVHLENGQRVYFTPETALQQAAVPPGTTLTAFFTLCQTDDFARTLLYNELPRYYTWDKRKKVWKRRAQGEPVLGFNGVRKADTLGRVYTVHPNNAECYFLRLLLHTIKGPTSFASLKTVHGTTFETFRQACHALGLLQDDSHWDATLTEAAMSHSPFRLRNLFAIMLVTCELSSPAQLWFKHRDDLSEDILHRVRQANPGMSDAYTDDIYNEALCLLEDKVISLGGQALHSTYGLPKPRRDARHALAQEILRETSYDVSALQAHITQKEPLLLQEQKHAYCTILDSVDKQSGGLFFLDAPGGTGKTFLLNLLLAKVRERKMIALAVASSGIAATLLAGGRTAHSTFKLPVKKAFTDKPTCSITNNSALAEVLRRCRLIVWDEATMANRELYEALDRTLRFLRHRDVPMGGITFLMAGDFRQTLPVIAKGTKADELRACLKSSALWRHVKQLHLTTNMRVHVHRDASAAQFSQKLLQIGNGSLPTDPKDGLCTLPCGTPCHDMDALKQAVFPDMQANYGKPAWLCERAILAPKNDSVDRINDDLIKELPGQVVSYKSVDTVEKVDEATEYPVEFLNSLQPPGLPPHNLTLKTGAPVMLLRNLDPPRLCNGTRLIVKRTMRHVLEATILTANARGEDVFIPRIPLQPSDCPFLFKRLQFPVKLCFAMTINKAQGQTLRVVGLCLTPPCFGHGQLYVGCSRVGDERNLHVLTERPMRTENIVYQEAGYKALPTAT